jgi:hypothetical protein
MLQKLLIAAAILLTLTACTENTAPSSSLSAPPTPPPLDGQPISVQIRRAQPRLASLPFRVLLDFEKPLDLDFLDQSTLAIDPAKPHTGQSALKLNPSAKAFSIKLSSLITGPFPSAWTVAGAHFYCESPATVTLTYALAQGQPPALAPRTIHLVPGKWTAVMADLTSLQGASESPGVLTFAANSPENAAVFCDDVLLINNDRKISPRPGQSPDAAWTITQRGFTITADRPARFKLSLRTIDERPDGWAMLEACELRARFVSGDGHEMTLYADGRQYTDGKLTLLTARHPYADAFEKQQQEPAEVEVDRETGRLDRDTPGDRNNDGYNELRGAYQLVAKGARLHVTLKPKNGTIPLPVLEISGLPAGPLQVNVAGRLIERTTRLDDGKVLIELPGVRLAATVDIAVK